MIYIIIIVDIAAPPGIVEGNFCNKILTQYKYTKKKPIIDNKLFLNIIIHIFSRVGILVYLMIKGDKIFGIESDRQLEHNVWNDNNGYHMTVLFCVLFFMILIHLILIVLEVNNNFVLYGFNAFILVVVQLCIVNYGGKITRTKPLSQNDLLKCFGFASLTIPFYYLLKVLQSSHYL